MLKVTIEGEVFSYDETQHPLAEAITIEEKLGLPYGELQALLGRGSAKAMAGFVWSVLHRDGRDVTLESIVSGDHPVNTEEIRIEAEAEPPNPTGTGPAEDPASPPTGGSTSGSSPRRSATPRPRSGS